MSETDDDDRNVADFMAALDSAPLGVDRPADDARALWWASRMKRASDNANRTLDRWTSVMVVLACAAGLAGAAVVAGSTTAGVLLLPAFMGLGFAALLQLRHA